MDVWSLYGVRRWRKNTRFVMARERRLGNDPVAACSRGPDGDGGKTHVALEEMFVGWRDVLTFSSSTRRFSRGGGLVFDVGSGWFGPFEKVTVLVTVALQHCDLLVPLALEEKHEVRSTRRCSVGE